MKKKLTISAILFTFLIVVFAVFANDITQEYGTNTDPNIASLNSLASSATAGWQSDVIDNRTTKALDYEIMVSLDMANTAAANDKAVYVYICPAYHDGTSWFYNDGGTTTLPSGAEGTYTIAATNNLVLAAVIKYTAADQVIQKTFRIGATMGYRMPDGFSLIIINYTGAAVAASGNQVSYKPINGDVAGA